MEIAAAIAADAFMPMLHWSRLLVDIFTDMNRAALADVLAKITARAIFLNNVQHTVIRLENFGWQILKQPSQRVQVSSLILTSKNAQPSKRFESLKLSSLKRHFTGVTDDRTFFLPLILSLLKKFLLVNFGCSSSSRIISSTTPRGSSSIASKLSLAVRTRRTRTSSFEDL